MAADTHFHGAISGRTVVVAPTAQTQNFYFNDDRESKKTSIPISTVPFLRDPDFVDRGSILGDIHEKLLRPGARVALVGIGGVGKSQLAIEYSYQVRERAPATWILWIHASNASRLEQSCQDIAERVKIPGRTDPKANMFRLVCAWLQDCEEKWLLILDNVDDHRVLEQSSPPLWTCLPTSPVGSILITTRDRQVATRLVEDRDAIFVDAMDKSAALSLLQKKLGSQNTYVELVELVQILDFMPLAITQAAAYIKRRAPRFSIVHYLKTFRKSPQKSADLLMYEHKGETRRRDWEAKNSLLVTWQISFDHIRRETPLAASLLSLMSLFDRQEIPADLLHGRYGRQSYRPDRHDDENAARDAGDSDRESSPESLFDDEFEEDLQILRDFSLISINADQSTFQMHALVQLATRYWLETNGKLDQWNLLFTEHLVAQFPRPNPDNWDKCRQLFPHAQSASSLGPAGLQTAHSMQSVTHWTLLLSLAAEYADMRGNWADTVTLAMKAMKARRDFFGAEDPKTVDCLDLIGNAQAKCGLWKEAEAIRLQVCEVRTKTLGLEHPDTIKSTLFLASTYWDQGLWQKAEELNLQVWEIGQRVLRPDDSTTLTSMNNLAATYLQQGRWKEAEGMQVRVIEAQKRTVGPLHPFTLTSMSNLGTLYYMQERWKEAESIALQVLESRKNVLGPDHPDTLVSMGNLSGIYLKQGRPRDAEAIEKPLLGTRTRLLGANHPDTLLGMHNLAAAWANMGRQHEAVAMMEDCVRLRERVIGTQHPDTIRSSTRLVEWRAKGLCLDKGPV